MTVWVLWLWVCAGVSCVISSGAVDDVDDACMDGLVTDIIHSVSHSLIQVSSSIMMVRVLV